MTSDARAPERGLSGAEPQRGGAAAVRLRSCRGPRCRVLGWEGRELWEGREPTWRRRSATLKARAALSAGFGSGSVRCGGRGETRRAYGAVSPGAPQLRGGERPDVPGRAGESRPPGLPSSGGGVPPVRPVAASPCADCLAGPGRRPPRPSLPAFLRSPGRAGRSFPFRPSWRPLPLPAFSRPASRIPLRLPPVARLESPPRVLRAVSPLQPPPRVRGWPGEQGQHRDSPRLGGVPRFQRFPADPV